VGIAVKTGKTTTFHESTQFIIKADKDWKEVRINPAHQTFKSEANQVAAPNGPIANLNTLQEIANPALSWPIPGELLTMP